MKPFAPFFSKNYFQSFAGHHFVFIVLLFFPLAASAQNQAVTVMEKEGRVESARAGANIWQAAQTNETLHLADRIRTGERSRATLHLLDQSTLRMFELSEFLVEPLESVPDKPVFSLSRGLLYFFHRDKPVDVQFKTRTATAAIRGTEFQLAVADDGRTELTMYDGAVELSNSLGTIQLKSGEQGVVEPGRAPVKSPVINARNLIQWCLYYPGVLAVDELHFDPATQGVLQDSIAAYRTGDLLAALAAWPANHLPVSESEKTYHAGLLLSVGNVIEAQSELAGSAQSNQLAAALWRLIAVVNNNFRTNELFPNTNSATELLVQSYEFQAQSRLNEALAAAKKSVLLAPEFAFGWARVAELEFGFGRAKAAQIALEKSLRLAPRNAEAVSLKGFTLAAQNKIPAALQEFDRAIALDGALGNAWLGRGLCHLHQGQISAGREDIQIAATLEPQRALFRSYLGKAWNELGNLPRAGHELELAMARDPNDPTAWLYQALLLQEKNRINEGIESLEHSQELNDNRQVYRSRLLLDQDRAVGGANLANIYRDAGMTDIGVREAVKAVNDDYANYSAHLFLANSYNDLRDPQGVNLRYETPYVSEYLVANLLAPAGAGTLSQQISQQEYSKLFERDGFNFSSDTRLDSRSNWRQSAAQLINSGNTSVALEEFYDTQNGYRPNSDQTLAEFDFRLKQQLSPDDSLFFQVTEAESSGGNLAQYYNQTDAALSPFRFRDRQNPVLIAGLHHEWNPDSHTLILLSRLSDDYSVTNPLQTTFNLFKDSTGALQGATPVTVEQDYRSKLEIYTAEIQQIWQAQKLTTILGARYDDGGFNTYSRQDNFQPGLIDLFPNTVITNQKVIAQFSRASLYGYEHWQLLDNLKLVGGLSYERIVLPDNYRLAPIAAGSEATYHLLPKAGLIWTPKKDTAVRAAFTRSAAGASFDQSFQLEPTEVAGFNQAYRSLIPESVAGANAGAEFTTYGLTLEHRFRTHTYLTLSAEHLESAVRREVGAFQFVDLAGPSLSLLPEHLDFNESSAAIALHQLAGRDWTFGATYRISRARLKDSYPGVSPDVALGFSPVTDVNSTLQSLDLQAVYQNPAGWFSRLDVAWLRQDNSGYQSAIAGDDFWQINLLAGWRFARRHLEISVGVMNLGGQNYRLAPLNLHPEFYRDRAFVFQTRFNF